MACLLSQAAVIVVLTWISVFTTSEAAPEDTCNQNVTCAGPNEICTSDICKCNTGYFNVNGVCKPDTISVTLSPSSTSVVYGSDAVLTATITSEVTVNSITWQKMPSGGSLFTDLVMTGGEYTQTPSGVGPGPFNLTIKSVDFGDGGTKYQVKVRNDASKDNTSNQVSVTVTGGVLTVDIGKNVIGKVGGSVTIICSVEGPEQENVWWVRYSSNDSTTITIDGDKYSGVTLANASLTINKLAHTDRAQYECRASNPAGNYSSTNKATVEVYGKLNENCSEQVPCEPDQNLQCTNSKCVCIGTHYHKDKSCYDRKGLTPNISSISSTTSSLFVSWNHPNVHFELVTEYEVVWQVHGSFGSNYSSGKLDRTFNNYSASTDLVSGQQYTVFVIAHVNLTEPDSNLTLKSPDKTERLEPMPPGQIIENESNFGYDNISIKWTAPENTSVTKYEVTIEGTNYKQETTNSNPSISFGVTSLVPGKHYNVQIVTVSGTTEPDVKRSSPYVKQIRITPTQPGPPNDVQCPQQPLDVSLHISWTAPNNSNGRIAQYQINVDSPGYSNTLKTGSPNTYYNVLGLKAEHNYTFTVQTINDAEESTNISVPSDIVSCETKAGVASSPTNLIVNEIGSRSFEIKFAVPINVSGILAGYKIIIYNGEECVQQITVGEGDDCSKCVITNKCPAVIYHSVSNISEPVTYNVTDLNPYTSYIVRVAAVNGVGEGHLANDSATTKEEIPEKPDNISAKDIAAKSLTLCWNLSEPSPGNTFYTIYVYQSTDDKGSSFVLNQTLTIDGFKNKSINVSKMEEYWLYKFEVNAATVKGNKTSDESRIFRTNQAAPGQVVGFTVKRKGEVYTKAYVSWNLPDLRDYNGVLKHYIFTSNFTGESVDETLDVDLSQQTIERNFPVTPETLYHVKVALRNNENMTGPYVGQPYEAPPGPPPPPVKDFIATKPGEHAPSENTIAVKVNYDFFKNKQNGMQVFFGIAVCADTKCDENLKITSEDEWRNLQNWYTAKGAGFTMYRVTNETFMEKVRQGVIQLFIIGNETSCSSNAAVYCNGPLSPGTSYKIIIFACTNGGCRQSDPLGPFATKALPEDDKINLGIIGAAVAGVVAVAIVIGVVFLIRRRRNGHDPSKGYKEKIDDTSEMEDHSVSKNIPRKRPIRLKELGDKVADKHKDSNLHFAREYDDLKALCAKHTTETSETDSNKLKNRYVNILPFDHSRVKLMLTEDDDPSTDFINANYLPGYRSPREYIATQGPIPGTIDDFWRMIWEQNVSIIVMLTLCKEEGRVKCEMYWPENTNEPKQYGDLVVETVSNSTVNFYDFRIFKIKLGDTTRSVKHFHFLQWKDFSANVQNDVMIDFIKNVRNHIRPPDMNGPVVVHCSAGVGRTGTYCALDHLFQFIDDNINDLDKSIDIFDLVMNLREQRMCMVQTEQQYVFIHDCVRDYVEKKLKELNGNLLYENVNQAFVHEENEEDESLYQNYSNQRTDL